MSESELIVQLKTGSQEAVRVWFERYRNKVLAYVRGKISNEADAEELTQDVFLNALKQLPLFQGKSQLLTWMLSIARHEVGDYYRKKYAKKVLKLLPLEIDAVANGVVESVAVDTVQAVLEKLDATHQELLLMKYIDDKSVAEIARDLRKSIKAIESELFRARREFKVLYLQHAQVTL